jgi:CheY-like chemotaxis protein
MNGQATKPEPKKILVADDDQVILKTVSLLLNANGYKVLTATDCAGAASLIEREQPDLVVLDIQFPPDVMNIGGALQDGFFVMEWLRRMGKAKAVPVMIISASNAPKDRERALNAGAVAFFTKPIDRPALLAAIRQVLGAPADDSTAASGS